MRNKASLVLMEQLVMLLVFAIAAAVCLNIFVKSKEISNSVEQRETAALMAQNTAELLKSSGGDFAYAALILDGSAKGDSLSLVQDEFSLNARKLPSVQSGLGQALIEVSYAGEPVFSLELGYREAAE